MPTPIVLTLDAPKEALHYRASLALDVINNATSPGGEVVLYLDVSIDGGTTRANQVLGSSGVAVSSLATLDRGAPVDGLNGSIYMELEECQ